MKLVRRKDTAPELVVRRFLHARGLRFRLHGRLPGTPDLVFPGRTAVVFVHGCFWHGHTCPHGAKQAQANVAYWASKIADNQQRDRRRRLVLRKAGWHVEVVWECEVRQLVALERLAQRLLAR